MAKDNGEHKYQSDLDLAEPNSPENEATERNDVVKRVVETAKLLKQAGYSLNARKNPEQQRIHLKEKRQDYLSRMALAQQEASSEKTNLMLQYVTPVLANRVLRRLEMAPTRSTKRRN